MKEKSLRWINLISLLVVVVINFIAARIGIGGVLTSEVSDSYPTLFTPSGITFSIWGIIYALLTISLIMIIFDKKSATKKEIKSIGSWFVISCILNVSWILLWQFKLIFLSFITITLLALSLYVLSTKVRNVKIFNIAISIYTGWITVATVANLFVLLSYLGLNMLSTGSEIITIIAIIGSAFLMGFLSNRFSTIWYNIAVLWAYIGMLIKQISAYNNDYGLLISSIIIAIITTVIFSIKKLNLSLRYSNYKKHKLNLY